MDDFENDDRLDRLVDWNVEVFTGLIKRVVAQQSPVQGGTIDAKDIVVTSDQTPLTEVREIIALPEYSAASSQDPDQVEIPAEVKQQLRKYGTYIHSLA